MSHVRWHIAHLNMTSRQVEDHSGDATRKLAKVELVETFRLPLVTNIQEEMGNV